MNVTELKVSLCYLIEKYVMDDVERERLLRFLEWDDIPVKGIIIDLTPFTRGNISKDDYKLIGEISYYFC